MLGKRAQGEIWNQTETAILTAFGKQVMEPRSAYLGLCIQAMGVCSR